MLLNATDISLIFLGILIVLVLLEVRKLSRKPEPVSRLEAQFERLSQQMERIAPPDLKLPGGAQIVEAGQNFETISEQLERLGRSAADIDTEMMDVEDVRRFLAGIGVLQTDLRAAREHFEKTATQVEEASTSIRTAADALRRVESRLDGILRSAGPRAAPSQD
jgi:chromosome segregation ATPase